MCCEVIDWEVPARCWMLLRQIPYTTESGCSWGSNSSGLRSQVRIWRRTGCASALKISDVSRSTMSKAYRDFLIH